MCDRVFVQFSFSTNLTADIYLALIGKTAIGDDNPRGIAPTKYFISRYLKYSGFQKDEVRCWASALLVWVVI